MTKALSKKRRKGAGRPLKAGKLRKPSGRIRNSDVDSVAMSASAKQALEERLSVESGTWKRMKEAEADGEIITMDEARAQERGSVLHNWLKASDHYRNIGRPELAVITREQFDALIEFQDIHARHRAMLVKKVKSSTDFDRTGGHDNSDPFGKDGARDERIAKAFSDSRKVILEAGSMAMFAVETIVFENKDVWKLAGDLRLAANALNNLKKVKRAA